MNHGNDLKGKRFSSRKSPRAAIKRPPKSKGVSWLMLHILCYLHIHTCYGHVVLYVTGQSSETPYSIITKFMTLCKLSAMQGWKGMITCFSVSAVMSPGELLQSTRNFSKLVTHFEILRAAKMRKAISCCCNFGAQLQSRCLRCGLQ